MERPGCEECISSEALKTLVQNSRLPSAQEQLNNFIEWLGRNQEDPGIPRLLSLDALGATGAASPEGMRFIVKHAMHAGLISDEGVVDHFDGIGGEASLTLAGWSYFEELQRGRLDSATAFMAMKFGDSQLDALYADYLKKAVEDTGFKLKKLDEGQPAGLIDDRLRVEIRQARFLIADLTHHNNGAYWEAGYAEGLGKPVIYMCRKDVFDDQTKRPHFDTNHHLTVVWSPGEEAAAVRKLKDTIRATLPAEAVITDPGDA
jgi:nucleoside 2-deoxyribosyltransferase